MKLYEIDQAIMACIDFETGEILDFEALEALQMERDAKLENIALAIKNLTSEVEAIKAEEKALAERRKAKENKVEGLKRYLADALGGEKFETARVRLSFRTTPFVEVSDKVTLLDWLEKHNATQCIRYTMPEISKPEVAKLLKAGEEIPGATLSARSSLLMK